MWPCLYTAIVLLAVCLELIFQPSASLGTTQRAIVPPSWGSRRHMNTSSLCCSAYKVPTVDMITPVKNSDSATRIGKSFTERVCRAGQAKTSLGSWCSCCISGTRKVHFSPAIERSSTSYPFRSAIVFGNATHRSIRETECKLLLYIRLSTKQRRTFGKGQASFDLGIHFGWLRLYWNYITIIEHGYTYSINGFKP